MPCSFTGSPGLWMDVCLIFFYLAVFHDSGEPFLCKRIGGRSRSSVLPPSECKEQHRASTYSSIGCVSSAHPNSGKEGSTSSSISINAAKKSSAASCTRART